MTREEMLKLFSDHDEDFLKFELIPHPIHRRPDLCAFIWLDSIAGKKNRAGGYSDMVSAAEHDVIYLDVDLDELALLVTPDEIRDLVRCGVMMDEEFNCLSMFV